ncbi:MAG: iron-siderophore ABC transporter substrate-binding protein, partial [Pseudonocardiaceae bacterium]
SVFSPRDPKMVFMSEMGFTMPEPLTQFVGTQDVVTVSFERLDLLESDRLVWLTDDPASTDKIKTDPLYQKLAVAAQHRDLFVSYEDPPVGAALSFNTVLSIPYAAEQLEPLLAAPQQQ